MNDMEKKNLLERSKKIISSERFRSKKEARLLEYLVTETLEGRTPKETTIAIELFHKDDRFNPADDSLVRSSMYALRKRLDEYYLDEGRDEHTRIRIPKGKYRVELVDRQLNSEKRKPIQRLFPWILFLLALLFSMWILLTEKGSSWKFARDSSRLVEHPVWGSFVENRQPVKIVLGDHFLVERENADSTYSYLRDLGINSEDQLRDAISSGSLPGPWRQGYGHSFVGEEMPQVAFELFQLFRKWDLALSISLASDINAADLASNNIIYVGGYRSLGILDRFLSKSNYRITDTPSTIIYKGELQADPTWTGEGMFDEFGIDRDYVLISKMKGSSDTDILFILSTRAFGRLELLKMMTSEEFVRAVPEVEDGDYWEIFFEVSGMENSGLSHERIYFDYLEQ
jgi:hypothetical protein